jgi:hypothetical protein
MARGVCCRLCVHLVYLADHLKRNHIVYHCKYSSLCAPHLSPTHPPHCVCVCKCRYLKHLLLNRQREASRRWLRQRASVC